MQAPSGSNSQPWRFEVSGGTVSLFMLPEKDHPVLNVNQWGTLFAHGALIENISVAAAHHGFEAIPYLFPEKTNRNLTAQISFREKPGNGTMAEKELWNAIPKRATNRKPYGTEKIDGQIRERLLAAPAAVGVYDIALKLIDDRGQIATLAQAASMNERVIFANRQLHELFFKEIVWTEQEERERKTGLYLKTLELKPPQLSALKLLRSWTAARAMNALFGAARGIASDNAKVYAACSFYGGVICGTSDTDLVHAGQITERAWLSATAMGLSFHLQTGVNFLRLRLETPESERLFSLAEANLIRNAYDNIRSVFQAGDRFVPAMFRIGRDGEPSARSSRKSPEVVWK